MIYRAMLLTVAVAALSLTGCAMSDMTNSIEGGSVAPTSQVKAKASNPAKVKLYYSGESQPKHYKNLGRVSAAKYNLVGVAYSQTSLQKKLKTEAASLGANAVVNIDDGMTSMDGDAVKVVR